MGRLSKVGSVSAESVKKHTKRDWDVWVETLNTLGCQSLSHQDLVKLLKTKFRLTAWWQQEVARGYQIAIGLRIASQTLKGTYTTTATKSIAVTASKIFSLMESVEGQEIWLKPLYPVQIKKGQTFEREGGVFGEFRTVVINKKMRFTWIDEDWDRKTVVQIHLHSRPSKKCMIVIDHVDLPSLKAKMQMHGYWRAAIDRLAEALKAQ